MSKTTFAGVYPALITPLKKDGAPDLPAQRIVIKKMMDAGVHGFVILGSNGENPYLTGRDKKKVIQSALKAIGGRVPAIVGVSEHSTEHALWLGHYAKKCGADGLMIGTLTYFNVGLEGALLQFRRFSGELNMPIFYYNFPAVMNWSPTASDLAEIFKIKNVIGIKESIASMKLIRSHMQAQPRGKKIVFFGGFEWGLMEMLKAGGAGLIGGMVNAFPELFVEVYEESVAGRRSKALLAQKKIDEAAPIFFGESVSPEKLTASLYEAVKSGAPIAADDGPKICLTKEVMRLRGYPVEPTVSQPMPPIKPYQKKRIETLLKKFGHI